MRRALAVSGALCVLLPAAATAKGDPDPIRYVAANCANCHGTMGRGGGAMPALAGLQKAYFLEQMRAFRDGKRPATVMQQIAKGYSDLQIEQLAGYFARQPAR
ncbi:MAG TPA: c-type cytochrome [Burkholderiaceae bacterium]|nr:c-type cytochrome [Burkholderiaceae bacterium]